MPSSKPGEERSGKRRRQRILDIETWNVLTFDSEPKVVNETSENRLDVQVDISYNTKAAPKVSDLKPILIYKPVKSFVTLPYIYHDISRNSTFFTFQNHFWNELYKSDAGNFFMTVSSAVGMVPFFAFQKRHWVPSLLLRKDKIRMRPGRSNEVDEWPTVHFFRPRISNAVLRWVHLLGLDTSEPDRGRWSPKSWTSGVNDSIYCDQSNAEGVLMLR